MKLHLKLFTFALLIFSFGINCFAQDMDTITMINFDTYEEILFVTEASEENGVIFRADGLEIDPWDSEAYSVELQKLYRIFEKGFSVVINKDEMELRMRPTKCTMYEGEEEGVSLKSTSGLFSSDIKGRLKSGDRVSLTAFNILVSHKENKVHKIDFLIK